MKYLVDGGDDGGRLLAGHALQGGAQEGGAGTHRLQADLLLLRVQVGVGTVPHKLGRRKVYSYSSVGQYNEEKIR